MIPAGGDLTGRTSNRPGELDLPKQKELKIEGSNR